MRVVQVSEDFELPLSAGVLAGLLFSHLKQRNEASGVVAQ